MTKRTPPNASIKLTPGMEAIKKMNPIVQARITIHSPNSPQSKSLLFLAECLIRFFWSDLLIRDSEKCVWMEIPVRILLTASFIFGFPERNLIAGIIFLAVSVETIASCFSCITGVSAIESERIFTGLFSGISFSVCLACESVSCKRFRNSTCSPLVYNRFSTVQEQTARRMDRKRMARMFMFFLNEANRYVSKKSGTYCQLYRASCENPYCRRQL